MRRHPTSHERRPEPQPDAQILQLRRSPNNGWHKPVHRGGVVVDDGNLIVSTRQEHREHRASTALLGDRPGRELYQEYRELIAPLLRQGWRYAKNGPNGKGKPRITSPEGRTFTLPNTPSDWRGLKNTRKELRSLGAAL